MCCQADMPGFMSVMSAPDLLFIYDIDEGVLVLTLFRTGSHSDLF